MYQALIVDDEKHIRQTISLLGQWETCRFSPPLFAADGQQALAILQSMAIDLVLVDIKMPVMDGMEFLRLASVRYPKIKYVIVSGYGDFEYARQAIKYHIFEYLLKPISESELNRCLALAAERLLLERSIQQKNPVLWLNECIVLTQISYAGFYIALTYIGQSAAQSLSLPDLQQVIAGLQRSLQQTAQVWGRVEADGILMIGIGFLKPSASLAEAQLQKETANALRETVLSLRSLLGVSAIASLSPFVPSITQLDHAYQTALHVISHANLLQCEQPVLISSPESIQLDSPSGLFPKKEPIAKALKSNSSSLIDDILRKHFTTIEQNGFLSIDFLCRTYAEILLIFHEVAREQGFTNYTHSIPSISSQETFRGIAAPRDVIKRAMATFKALCDCQRNVDVLGMDDIIQQIKDYIDQNFDNDIGLQLFSEKYYLSKEYLSKQFKELHRCSIYEYLLIVRMDCAGQLLTTTDLKIQEIALRCGYNDTNYFSKAFKAYYGVSPKEHRQQA